MPFVQRLPGSGYSRALSRTAAAHVASLKPETAKFAAIRHQDQRPRTDRTTQRAPISRSVQTLNAALLVFARSYPISYVTTP